MTRPQMQVGTVTITAAPARARELAEFYERLLGWPIVAEGPKGGWAQLRPPEGETGPTINIESDREYERPVWPSTVSGQNATMHLDIGVDDLDEAVAWALEAGATLANEQSQEHVRVMLDAHGNPFCLC
ncbi:VOC family protein [Actinopolymorpha pittospori]|uniref:Catechol 2,3-dioxygenase-like lactoylglutathione lyase family enzyme n=1 Tax=Actinopolymorpha pittospori TaxID=648752 RepID=A0A927RF61_9ACTN|nr:VOC family protein [Actinopolymorpha pittospori]MBE1609885.1 catechol 2,3-dioxygenase-like lactoylglutathione lyase family enzyme [Actinopolymorpha pittospori]